ncbi:N-carbamoyl-D-amino-acid hydrolase [Bordetella sp. 15P40C-2]|uniref:N-carbamoyl-D-amino-acid hydrolase n=1 Tax=Bordetella sp. 15P40C-2 TaxID=2572246 RepID=UPI001325224D|nr:N-carbamoyl-D-amino-acid hydrolase [Bordetella sp. 15P40C-2]MVW72642.1 N-carbamoyl-D-amino-acid hydrolase [Bordetella sp. 15P40C-2]
MSNTGKNKRTLGLAVAQMGPVHLADTRESVVARLVDMLRQAHARGATFVVFPELALTTFFPRYWMSEAEAQERFFEREMPGPATQTLFDEARRLNMGFYLGYAELTPEGVPYNTAILVDRAGNIVGKYRKIHLPGHDDHKVDAPFQHLEKKFFNVGDEPFGVWDTMGTRVGMCLCNDRRWPETWRMMSLQSAEVVVLGYNTPSQNIHWPEPVHLRMHHHLITLQASAYQNCVWAAAAAKCGSEDGHHMIGGSVIVAPTGEIAAQSVTEDDEVITVQVDLDQAETFRRNVFDFARHRRPEHYHLITERVGPGEPLPRKPV